MVPVTRIEEHPGAGRLGRHIQHDPESRHFSAPVDSVQLRNVTHTATRGTLPLDQGDKGSCTAEAVIGALDMAPWQKRLLQLTADSLYHEETILEDEPWPPNDPGGTGLMVCKAAKNMKLISGYLHTFSLRTALQALVTRPIMVGTNWYDSFDKPRSNGMVSISPGAQIRGGHEYVARGLHIDNETVWFWNSWGPEFGLGGRFCMSYDTLNRLLHEQGDVTIPYV